VPIDTLDTRTDAGCRKPNLRVPDLPGFLSFALIGETLAGNVNTPWPVASTGSVLLAALTAILHGHGLRPRGS